MSIDLRKVFLAALIAGVLSAAGYVQADEEKAVEPEKSDAAPAFSLPFMAAPAAAAPDLAPDAELVKVGDHVITQGDLNEEIAQITSMMQKQGRPPQQVAAMINSLRPQVLDSLVVRALLEDEFTKKKIVVSDDEINKEIANIKASLPKDVVLEDLLAKNGGTEQTFKKDLLEQLKLIKLLNIADPDEKEIKAFYEENKARFFDMPETVHARHILITVDASADAAQKAKKKVEAEEILKQLKEADADFAKIALEKSDCPSKNNGGDLGRFRKGQMVPQFEAVAFELKANEISGVVETEFGYHIIQTIEHQEPKTIAYEEAKNQIIARLKNRQLQQRAAPMLETLRENAKISYSNGAEPPKPAMFPMMGDAPAVPSDKPKVDDKSEKPAEDEPVENPAQ